MEEVASEPESQTSNFGVTRVSTQSLIVLYKKVCLISLISAVCRDLSSLLLTDWRVCLHFKVLYKDSGNDIQRVSDCFKLFVNTSH